LSHSLSSTFIYSGTLTWILLPINLPNSGPATIIAGIPTITPNIITHPKSAPIRLATAIGPGVGGINA